MQVIQEIRTLPYLERPLVDDTEIVIEPNQIKILVNHENSVSIYAQEVLGSPMDADELLRLYREVAREAKRQGVKISYRMHIRRSIEQGRKEYARVFEQKRVCFAELCKQAEVVRRRGLHMGLRDDEELEKLQTMCGNYQAYQYRSSILSKWQEIRGLLERHKRSLRDHGVDGITL